MENRKKRYTVSWTTGKRHYKAQYDLLEDAEAKFQKVLGSDRLRLAKLIDNADILHPVTLQTGLRIKR